MDELKRLVKSISNDKLQDAQEQLSSVISQLVNDKKEAADLVVKSELNLTQTKER